MKQQTKSTGPAQKLGAKAVRQAYNTPAKETAVQQPPAGVGDVIPAGHSSRKLFLTLLFLIILPLVSFGLLYFAKHQSLAAIYVGPIPIKADEQAAIIQQKIDSATKDYKITIVTPGGEEKRYSLAKAGLTIDPAASADQAKKHIGDSFLQRLMWWQDIGVPLAVRSNDLIFKTFIARHATKAEKPVTNAGIAIDNGKVVIKPSKAGSGYTVIGAHYKILDSVSYLSAAAHKMEPSALKPSIVQSDLTDSADKIEKILAQKVVLNLAERQLTAGRTDIGRWLDLSPVPSAKTVDVTVNSGKVLEYINQAVSPYVHPPRNRLVVKENGMDKVLDTGVDGSDIANKDKAAGIIAKRLLGGKGVSVDLPITYAKTKTINVKSYAKWLIVDLTTKRMYAYEQDKLVKSFLVSAGAPLTPTVEGQFSITYKVRIQDMRGANADGSRYFQPDVQYVNYFYRDYAIHGNYWRPLDYFGNINSSHGCVGIVNSDAAWVYEWAPVGTPVIVHS